MKRSANESDFPGVVIKRKKKFSPEVEKSFQTENGAPKKKPPSSSASVMARYEHLKADALKKQQLAQQFPDDFDKMKKNAQVVRQLPVDANGLLPEWDPETMGNDYTIAIFGKRRTGKTWIARHLLHLKRQAFFHGMVITKTKFNGFWQNYFPAAVVHGTYDPAIIEQFMLLSLEIEEYNRAHPDKQINRRSVIVLDDVIADKHVRYDDTLATLFYNGRHFEIFLIICSQYVFGLPPGLRSNADLVFVLRQFQKRQRDQLQEDFGDMLDNPDEFYTVMDENTKDNQCMVIDLSDPKIPVEQMFSRWLASDPGLFEIGSYLWKKQVWDEGEEELKEKYTFN